MRDAAGCVSGVQRPLLWCGAAGGCSGLTGEGQDAEQHRKPLQTKEVNYNAVMLAS
jgi:hypothetical protein